jgi:YD repeat-containing protein
MKHRFLIRSRNIVLVSLLLLTLLWPSVTFQAPLSVTHDETRDEILKQFEPYVDYLNEFTERRRLKVYFTNDQSVVYGAQVGYVNVGRGNLTFVRRDLVTVGRIPLVLARVYDSRLEPGEDFGQGWHLSAAETIKLEPDGSVALMSESATVERFIPSGDRFVQAKPCPTDLVDLRQVDAQHFQAKLRTGFTKEYTLIDEFFRLTRVEDRNGNAVTLEYKDGRLARMRGQNNRVINLTRDKAGRIVSGKDDQGRQVRYRYNESGQLKEVIDLGGNRWRYEYDEIGRLIKTIDPLRHVNFAIVYDDQGRVTDLQSSGGSYRYRYESSAPRTIVTDGNGYESVYVQNDDGITTAIKNPLGVETSLVLDERNHVQKLYRNQAVQAEMSYDSEGRLASLVNDGEKTEQMTYVYDELGRLVEIKNGDHGVVLRYDDRGNLLERTEGNEVTRYTYSPKGDLLTMLMADGTSLRFEVDSDGQITSVVDAQNRQTRFKYYKDGKLSETRFADRSTRTYGYTRLGTRRLKELDDGAPVEYSYNAAGSLTEIKLTRGDGTILGERFTLDEDQKPRVIQYLRGGESHLVYDRMGNLTTVSIGDHTLRFAYDRLSRLIEIVTLDGKRLRYNYRDGEPDLRLQMDHHTGRSFSDRITSGLTFSSGLELLRNRTEPSTLAVVRFDRALLDYRLASELGMALPDAAPASAIARMRVMELGQSKFEHKRTFNAPSNMMFIPSEYWALNCGQDQDCEAECHSDDDQGGSPDPFCVICCLGRAARCQDAKDECQEQAAADYVIAQDLCLAGLCLIYGIDSDQCIGCMTAAGTQFAVDLIVCQVNFNYCMNTRAQYCPGCPPCL